MQLVQGKNVETGKQEQELDRSKGGFSSKLHAACDALGNPLRFFVTAGQRSDYVKALEPVHNLFLTRTFSLSSFGFLPHFLK